MTRTKKSLGQHFLTNQATADKIVNSVSHDAKTIIEVGPGPGILTDRLVERDAHLICIEKDDTLAESLRTTYGTRDNVSIIHADFLKVNLAEVTTDLQTSLVGNFPYNISSQIVFRILELPDLFSEMVGMFQLEMARRVVASPGNKDYGVISVLAQSRYDAKLLFQVSPGQFKPPPKVKSAVIRLTRKADYALPCSEKWLRTVVKTSFGQRRKMLRNTLKPLLPGEVLKEELYLMRPEQLRLESFFDIANIAEEYSQSKKH